MKKQLNTLDSVAPPFAKHLVYFFVGLGLAALIIDWIPQKLLFSISRQTRYLLQVIAAFLVIASVLGIMKYLEGDKG